MKKSQKVSKRDLEKARNMKKAYADRIKRGTYYEKKTYMDKLMKNEEFRKRFEEEYQNICIGEQIAKIRHRANLTQDALAKRTHTTKSAISRYENSDYKSYSIPLLNRIAEACGTVLKIDFVTKGTKKN